MSLPLTVVVADFLEEAEHRGADPRGHRPDRRSPGLATRTELAPFVAEADAIILFHDIPLIGEATFARAPRLQVHRPRRGRVTTTSTSRPPTGTA